MLLAGRVLFLVLSRGTRGVGAPPFERCTRSAPGALVPVRVILSRSIVTYSAPSAPLAGTTRFRRGAAYTGCRRCASVLLSPTPRQPTSGSVLSLAVLCRHVVLWDPGKFLGCYHPVPSPTTLAFDLSGGSRHFPSPTLRFSWEGSFRGCPTVHFRYNLSTCSPPLSEPTGFPPSRRGLLPPGFRRFGHPLRRRISLQRQLGNFLWRVFPR